MYECESWTIKKAEHQTIDACKLWYWRRLLRVPWTSRRSNQSILKEISPEYLLEGLMLKLKLQYFGHLMRRADSFERPWCWERLKAGGEGDETTEDEMVGWHHRLNGHGFGWTLGVGDGQGVLACCMGSQRSDTTEQLNWTELNRSLGRLKEMLLYWKDYTVTLSQLSLTKIQANAMKESG